MINQIEALLAAGQWQQAIEQLQLLLEQYPNYAPAYFLLGNLYYQQKNYVAAIQYYQQAVALKPQLTEAHYNLATSYLVTEQFDDAINAYKIVIQQDQKAAEAFYNLAVIYEKLNQTQIAQQYYVQTLILQPDNLSAINNLAAIYFKQKNSAQALHYYQQLLKFAPDHEVALYMISALTQSKNSPPHAPKQYVAGLFDQYADHYDQHLVQQLRYQVPQLIFEKLKSLLDINNKFENVLDLGCGTGLIGQTIYPLASHITGVDLSAEMLTHAQNKNVYHELIQEDLLEFLKMQKVSHWHVIIAADTLLYFGDLQSFFANAARILKSNGYLIITTENSDFYPFQLFNTARYGHHPDYIKSLVEQNQLNMISYEEIISRKHNDMLQAETLWVFQK